MVYCLNYRSSQCTQKDNIQLCSLLPTISVSQVWTNNVLGCLSEGGNPEHYHIAGNSQHIKQFIKTHLCSPTLPNPSHLSSTIHPSIPMYTTSYHHHFNLPLHPVLHFHPTFLKHLNFPPTLVHSISDSIKPLRTSLFIEKQP